MEKVEYPSSLVYSEATISIYFEDKVRVNKTKSAIMISGNKEGFLSLSNLINVYNVYLYDPIIITEFSFVKSKIIFEIVEDYEFFLPDGYITKENDEHFKWRLGELNIFLVVGMLHSLGYANTELHFDTNMKIDDTSVYCVLD